MAKTAISEGAIMRTLDWAYGKAVDGLPGLDNAADLAKCYAAPGKTPKDQVNSLVRWQIAKATTSGFVTGLGGFALMPVTIPANLASIFFIQLRMIAAIAHLAGLDPRSDQVRTLAYACLCGKGATEVLKDAGIRVANGLGKKLVGKISGEVIIAINKKVGFRLLTKFGSTGVVNLGKVVPILGGLVGGTVDGVTTKMIGRTARDFFISEQSAGFMTSSSEADSDSQLEPTS